MRNDLLNQASLGAFGNRLLTVMIDARTCEKASGLRPPQLTATRGGVPGSDVIPTVSPGRTLPRPGPADTLTGGRRQAENTLRYIE